MGSDNSKPKKPEGRPEERFQYGPPTSSVQVDDQLQIHQLHNQHVVVNRQNVQPQATNTTATVSYKQQQAPPPPYSAVAPQKNLQRPHSVYESSVSHAPLPHPAGQNQTKVNAPFTNYVPPRDNNNNANTFKAPFPPQQVNHAPGCSSKLRKSMDNLQKISPYTSPLASPSYERKANPYVWVNQNARESVNQKTPQYVYSDKKKTIDLDLELPMIMERIKGNPDPSYQEMIKQIRKNKPLAEIRKNMVNNKYLSDVHFIVDGKIFYAHKTFLITASLLFHSHFELNGHKEMRIDSIPLDIFTKVMTYCYTDQLEPTEDDVLELMNAANSLQVRQITHVCSGFITASMNPNTIFIIFEKALAVENEHFKKKCLEFIKKHETQCFASKGFHEISVTSLISILDACNYPADKRNEIVEKHILPFELSQGQEKFIPPTKIPLQPLKAYEPAKKQTAKNPTPKKPPPKNNQPQPNVPNKKKNQHIPDLMSLPIPNMFGGPPPGIPPFPASYQNMHSNQQRPPNQFGKKVPTAKLISFEDDDDEESSIISKQDQISKMEVFVTGPSQKYKKPSSRIDFVCQRSMLIHRIRFTENLATTCSWVKLSIWIIQGDARFEIRSRMSNISEGQRLSFIPFTHDPLEIRAGQQFFIKVEFNQAEPRLNIDPVNLTLNDFVYVTPSADGNKHFNCIKSLTVSDSLAN